MSAGPLVKLMAGAKTSDLNPLSFPPRASSHASNISAAASQLRLVSSPASERRSAGARCALRRLEKRPPPREQQLPAPALPAAGELRGAGGETQPRFPPAVLPAPAGTGHVPTVPSAVLVGSGLCLSFCGSWVGLSITRARDPF